MDPHLRFANRLVEVVIGNLAAIEAWGFYLTSPEFDKEIELRNKLGTIWICSLIDTLEAEARFLPEIAKEAAAQNFDDVVHNAKQLGNFCTLVGELLCSFSPEEQIFLTDTRNQWVHSYFANRHRENVAVKYAENGKIVSKQIPWASYELALRPFHENGLSLDQTLKPLVERALDRKFRYWYAIGEMQQHRDRLYAALRAGERIRIDV
jgi:hypothetical protein